MWMHCYILFLSDKSNCKPFRGGGGGGGVAPPGLPLSLSGGWNGICYCRTGCGCMFRWVGEGKIEKPYYQLVSELLQFGVNCMSVKRNTNSQTSYPSCQLWFFQ